MSFFDTKKMKTALQFLMDGIVDKFRLSVPTGREGEFEEMIKQAYELQKQQIIKAYEEGYDAAFHHEQSRAEKYYIENT